MYRKLSRKNIFWMTVLLGALVAFQVRTLATGQKYIPLQQLQQGQLTLEQENTQLQGLRLQVEKKKEQLKKLEGGDTTEQQMVKQLQDEINTLKNTTGQTDLEGPGVIIIVSDGTRKLLENENPNNLVVHDSYLRIIVDDLRYAGAEAISVNDQRIVDFLSPISCNGPTIKVNDQQCSQPFIIKAIGDQDFLEAAINAPDSYANSLRQWGLFVEVNTSDTVKIPKFEGNTEFKYITPAKEGV